MVEQLFTATGEEKDPGRDQEEKVRTAKSETAPQTLGKAIVKATALRCQTGGNAYRRGRLIQPAVCVPDRQPTYASCRDTCKIGHRNDLARSPLNPL
jgi:hypothetical protein